MTQRPRFPFSAILGLDRAKISLLLHGVDPRLGGVLLTGHRGCAKTTLARAFGALFAGLPEAGRFVEAPLGASEERLLGGADPEPLVSAKQWRLRTGLLEDADRGCCYVDEVNLLPDSLADLMLDAAATGSYQLERDGFSRSVLARFVLIGSMNPDEGELRPQLSDRFAHSVSVRNQLSPSQKAEVIRRRIEFDDDPAELAARYAREEDELRHRIVAARLRLEHIELSGDVLAEIGRRAEELGLESMRAEIAVARTARALAAWEDRPAIGPSDLETAWELCLGRRETEQMPDRPPPAPPTGEQRDPEPRSPRPFCALNPETAKPDRVEVADTAAGSPICWPAPRAISRGVDWPATAIDWAKGGTGLVLRRLARRPNLWVFLDASRSAGTNGLLASARPWLAESLCPGAAKRLRCNLLVLREGRLQWLRRVGSESVRGRLLGIGYAAGSSSLGKALAGVSQHMRRASAGPGDVVILATDGLPTAPERTRQLLPVLRAMIRTEAAVMVVLPRTKRGFELPLRRLCLEENVAAEWKTL